MVKSLTENDRLWYFDALEKIGDDTVTLDREERRITYNSAIRTDDRHVKSAERPEELAHAVMLALLHSHLYRYPITSLGHEIRFEHGSKGSNADVVDIIITDEDRLPYAMIELKAATEFDREKNDAIKNQLFGTANLVGSPKLLVYATIEPKGIDPKIRCICIDYTKYKTYDAWRNDGEPHSTIFPEEYYDLDFKPYVCQGTNDLSFDNTQADFRAIALSFHNEFFGEHPDNTIFIGLVKCLLAKIHDERTTKVGEPYRFQIFYKNGKPQSAAVVFHEVNCLYKESYVRYIDKTEKEIDEISPKEFSEVSVKAVVQALQAISITKGAARRGDIIGTFFEEILRTGFKQDRGMYFTHNNIVSFMVQAVNLRELTHEIWQKSNHPENRLPYIIDPACGSGTFLLHAMNLVTDTVRSDTRTLVSDHDSQQFYNARMSDSQPNYWAEAFIYGFDPKFIMAITAKVNMVLHGDGSAHISKDDAFRPLDSYSDGRLRPCSEAERSVPRSRYAPDLCEKFDVVISNPPFGITLAAETRSFLERAFTLSASTSSEGIFLERCFQLLKPTGRLAVVLPESLFNAKEMAETRLFLYRFFNIRSIVSMPRNIFIDTPTLTSLLFAEKKTAKQIEDWDREWQSVTQFVESRLSSASSYLRRSFTKTHSGETVSLEFLRNLDPVITRKNWVIKGGKSPALLRMKEDFTGVDGEEAASYYKDIMKTAGFKELCQSFIFGEVAAILDQEFPVFIVQDVGYKLSKRKEKARPNQLCLFRGRGSGETMTNINFAEEECDVVIDKESASTVLDIIGDRVKWSER